MIARVITLAIPSTFRAGRYWLGVDAERTDTSSVGTLSLARLWHVFSLWPLKNEGCFR